MNSNIQIFKDSETMSVATAQLFILAANRAIETQGRFLVALSGGGTPSATLRLLATPTYQQQVDWQNIYVFWGDERCVPPDDKGSNYHQAMNSFLRHVPIPDENIFRIKGELEPVEASKEYNHILNRFASPPLEWPRFDLIMLGMGADGHTASLFAGSPEEIIAPTRAVTADYEGRPAQRVTLTEGVLNSARQVVFLVTGRNKAGILRQVLRDTQQTKILPAQRIHPTEGYVTWLIDGDAASEL